MYLCTPHRIVEFSVEDETNTTSATSLLTILITPVNDAPVLSFVSDPALRNGPLVQDGETGTSALWSIWCVLRLLYNIIGKCIIAMALTF